MWFYSNLKESQFEKFLSYSWMLMEAAAGLLNLPCNFPGSDPVQYTFSTAAKNGMTVLRVFAHGVNNTLPLQTSPGNAWTSLLSKTPLCCPLKPENKNKISTSLLNCRKQWIHVSYSNQTFDQYSPGHKLDVLPCSVTRPGIEWWIFCRFG